jgi:transketolase
MSEETAFPRFARTGRSRGLRSTPSAPSRSMPCRMANSGRTGTPMALAPMGYTLWRNYLRYDPATPDWPNRDRFVLSVGHASKLRYAMIDLAGIEKLPL